MLKCIFSWSVLLVAAFGVAGCGSGVENIGRLPVSGLVLMDGAPLDHGSINFKPYEAKKHQVGSGAVVENGKFSIPADQGLVPGKYTVAISAPTSPDAVAKAAKSAEDQMKNASAAAAETKERLPKKYNATTELLEEVKSSGKNEFTFKVESLAKAETPKK